MKTFPERPKTVAVRAEYQRPSEADTESRKLQPFNRPGVIKKAYKSVSAVKEGLSTLSLELDQKECVQAKEETNLSE